MRMGKLLAEEGAVEACYHCVTMVVERRFALGDREKEKFVASRRGHTICRITGQQGTGASKGQANCSPIVRPRSSSLKGSIGEWSSRDIQSVVKTG